MTEEMTDEQWKAAVEQWYATRDKHLIDQMTVEEWLAIRKQAGLKIDPEMAEVHWEYAQTLDPYGIYTEPPDECWQVGREYFARSPGSDIWVQFGDLPEATRDGLWERIAKAGIYSADWPETEPPF